MRLLLLIIIFFLMSNCSKPKTVLICGDHVCINKAEANQYFEDNLSIEVKILNKKIEDNIDLVQLNLKENKNKKKEISISSKDNTNKDLKTLSKEEIAKIKENIKINKNKNKIVKKNKVTNKSEKKVKTNIDFIKTEKKYKINKSDENNVNKNQIKIVDVCTILEKCSIDEISKYLLEQGKKKDFPDITQR
jgi:hypothetical protein